MKFISDAAAALHNLLSPPIGGLSNLLPGHGHINAFNVILVILFIVASVSSLLRSRLYMWEHMAGFRASEKLKARVENRRTRVDYQSMSDVNKVIDRKARATFQYQVLMKTIRSFIERFGGYFLTQSGVSIRNAFTLANLTLATFLVFSGWPDLAERNEWIFLIHKLFKELSVWLSSNSSLPTIAILVLSVWVFIGRAPLIDHIRARTDASVEANSRLLRASVPLYDLYLEAARWRNSLGFYLAKITDELVSEASDGKYRWIGHEICESNRLRWPRGRDCSSSNLLSAIDSLEKELLAMRESGVSLIATRLCGAAADHLDHAGVQLNVRRVENSSLSTKFWPIDVLRKRLASELPLFWQFDSMMDVKFDDIEVERQLERSAQSIRRSEVGILYEIELRALHLYRAANLLERRKVGTFWVRVLSAKYGK